MDRQLPGVPTETRIRPARVNLIGLSREDLAISLQKMGMEPFRVEQLWNWIYVRGATGFDQMDSVARRRRTELAESFSIDRPWAVADRTSTDGSRKWLLRNSDGRHVEAVWIPEEDRGALCVSSQVGCSLTCQFCHTGTMPQVRNLTAGEIVSQVMVARDRMNEWQKHRRDRLLTNIVMMGMGEPLLNYNNVRTALRIVMDGAGIAISRRRITLSTAGVAPMIERAGRELGVNLAISLHAVRDELRDELVPLNRKYPIAELLEACRRYPAASNARRITFEYVMLNDVNDSPVDARELVRLLKGIAAKVNLIPWNPWPGATFERSTSSRINAFARIINDGGFSSAVRATRGDDIMAACGQLASQAPLESGSTESENCSSV